MTRFSAAECLSVLLTLCGAEVNTVDGNGCSPLFYTVTLGYAECTELLLESGADPDIRDRKAAITYILHLVLFLFATFLVAQQLYRPISLFFFVLSTYKLTN